jgi:putative DNA primase/helicase
MLGRNNVSSVPLDRLADGHRFASAEMFMRTANVCGDLAATHLRDTSTFKQLTGGDPVFAERKMRDPFAFTWWGVPIFSANAVPGADDTSHGFLSRWEIIRFPVDLTGRCDPGIESRLIAELPGVIVRAVDAVRQVIADGDFSRPPAVIEAKAEFARSLDQVRGYLADWTTPGGWTKRDRIYGDYQQWARRQGHGELSARKFYERLRAAGVAERKQSGERGFVVTLGAPAGQEGAGRTDVPSPAARTGGNREHLPYVPQPAPETLTEEDLGTW